MMTQQEKEDFAARLDAQTAQQDKHYNKTANNKIYSTNSGLIPRADATAAEANATELNAASPSDRADVIALVEDKELTGDPC